MKKLKIILGLALILLGLHLPAQNGLERLLLEKYYVANAADASGSTGVLPAGSVTYRLYADLRPGYKLETVYGNNTHPLKITTTTSFFNNEDRGATTPNAITTNQEKTGTVLLDSWLSVGAAASGQLGIPKPRDTNGSIGNTSGLLTNNDPSSGIQILTEDGMIPGSPQAVTIVGFQSTADSVFGNISQQGKQLISTNGAWSALNGATGADTANYVLIAQLTTDGVLGFEINITIGTPSNGIEYYVARNPAAGETQLPSLLLAPNLPPVVSISSPATGSHFITGTVVPITATASDPDGTVASVEFFVDGVSIGVVNSAPYTKNYTSTAGTHALTAKATDNLGAVTTSAPVSIIVSTNTPPSVSITAPANGANYVEGDAVAITATASDVDGTVASVEFFVDGVSIGLVSSAPYTANYTSVFGSHTLTAKATDNLGATTTSAAVTINVAHNIPPVVSITAPANGANYTAPAVVTINASASDPDGTVANVEFFVNGVSIGVVTTAPYTKNWTSVIGTANLTAVATDNKGAKTTSAQVTINIADANHLPYRLSAINNTCLPTTFCEPLFAVDTVKNVIGYDLVLHYNKAKVTPTGNITIGSDLINPTYVATANSIDTANSLVNISLFLNANAPGNAFFHGVGDLACVEFTKTNSFGPVDTANFTVSGLQESYIVGVATKLAQAGKYSTYRDSLFHGTLNFWLDGSPIAYNAANPNQFLITNVYGNNTSCSSKSVAAVQPDVTGNFTYDILKGNDLDIERDILATTDVQPVINGADALLGRKLLVNDPSFIPTALQIVALDVNLDGVISAGDISQINQRSVLAIPEFKQAWNYNNQGVSNGKLSKDWLFIDVPTATSNPAYMKSATFPNDDGVGFSKARVPVIPFCLPVPVTNEATCPLIGTETFDGVLLGDVNGNYKDIPADGQLKSQLHINASDKVIFDLSKAVVTGNQIDIPVSVSAIDTINALDFSLKFDESALQYDTTINQAAYIQALAHLNTNDQTLRFTSNSMQQYSVGQAIVNVRFTMLSGTATAADLKTMKGYLNGDPTSVVVIDAPLNVLNISGNSLVKIYPNPASTVVNVEVPEKATIQMLDAEGRLVYFKSDATANQKQEINTQELADGVYLIKIYTDSFVVVKKLVINK